MCQTFAGYCFSNVLFFSPNQSYKKKTLKNETKV